MSQSPIKIIDLEELAKSSEDVGAEEFEAILHQLVTAPASNATDANSVSPGGNHNRLTTTEVTRVDEFDALDFELEIRGLYSFDDLICFQIFRQQVIPLSNAVLQKAIIDKGHDFTGRYRGMSAYYDRM